MKFRKAARKDILNIVRMIADDPLGRLRENYQDPLPDIYYEAFEKIYEAFEKINADPTRNRSWSKMIRGK